MNRFVISQHIGREPNRIDDLPGQIFMPGMEPDPEPVQAELFSNSPKRFRIDKHTIGNIAQAVYIMGKLITRDEALTKIETALRINHLYTRV